MLHLYARRAGTSIAMMLVIIAFLAARLVAG